MNSRPRFKTAFYQSDSVLRLFGYLLIVSAFVHVVPLLVLIGNPEEKQYAAFFLIITGISVFGGIILAAVFRKRKRSNELSVISGSVIITLTWIIVCIISTYPIHKITRLPFFPALFETVSAWTTTGLSVVDVSAAPKILLFYRSFMQFAGGAGLAIIMLAMFSLPVGAGLYRAEGKNDLLVPHIIHSAKLVLFLYSIYAVIGTVGYVIAGMSFFDAVNHSFCAISTGGFSTHPESIGYWDSVAVEAVTVSLMLLGNLNFLTAYILFKGKFRYFFKNGEVKVLIVLSVIGIILIFFLVTKSLYASLGKQLRVAVFEIITALTTTGFSTVGYNNWNSLGIGTLIVLMLIGGGSCSTAGGIKQMRIYILWKSFLWNISSIIKPRRSVSDHSIIHGDGKITISQQQIAQTGTFLFIYLITLTIGTLIITAYGYPLKDALFEFASSLGTVGLSIGITSPSLPLPILLAQIVGMLLGRLEFFVVFAAGAQMLKKGKILLLG